jgi:hypothetical protein
MTHRRSLAAETGHKFTELAASTESSVAVVLKRMICLPTALSDSDRPGMTTMKPPHEKAG